MNTYNNQHTSNDLQDHLFKFHIINLVIFPSSIIKTKPYSAPLDRLTGCVYSSSTLPPWGSAISYTSWHHAGLQEDVPVTRRNARRAVVQANLLGGRWIICNPYFILISVSALPTDDICNYTINT